MLIWMKEGGRKREKKGDSVQERDRTSCSPLGGSAKKKKESETGEIEEE